MFEEPMVCLKHAALYKEVAYIDPALVFEKWAHDSWNILLDSADGNRLSSQGTNRYSYIAIEPFKKMVFHGQQLWIEGVPWDTTDPLQILKEQAASYALHLHPELPPFQGGVAGLLSYDLCELYDAIPRTISTERECEKMAVGFYDLVQAFDHQKKRSWIFSSGLPYRDTERKEGHAQKRLQYYYAALQTKSQVSLIAPRVTTKAEANFTEEGYKETINKAIEYIKAGDIFEVNLAQRFSLTLPKDYPTYYLYKAIKALNPSPFSAYFNTGNMTIISSSPERFMTVQDSHVETRPIKGTRKRSADPIEDQRLAQDLIHSEKDRAENIMIVDLMRNDLSHVCEANSITVPQLCGHEIYPHVHHLVSVIHGTLKANYNAYDLLRFAFPGGSIAGAPKIRAMQIIAELEPHQRGPYCGSLFYASFDGKRMDSSILIRTYVLSENKLCFHGGGAVTIDSDPTEEYEETLTKVKALYQAISGVA